MHLPFPSSPPGSGQLPATTLSWGPVTEIISNCTLPKLDSILTLYHACHWPPLPHVECIKFLKSLTFWRSTAKPLTNTSTAQAWHRAWSRLRTHYCSFSNALIMETLPAQGCSKHRDLPFRPSNLCIKRLKLTVECWMGIQAGVSTEHLWDGHLPWLCCK